MDSLKSIVARTMTVPTEDSKTSGTVINLTIALLALVLVILISVAVLILLRKLRLRKQRMAMSGGSALPQYNDEVMVKRTGNHRRLTIQTGNGRSSVIVFNKDGQPMLANPQQPPHSPDNVPQIHITFPDEQDDQGRPLSGRVVVVRVGDTTVGLEPLHDEQLPAYEKESKSQFYAIDIEKIGGLKEKEYR